MRFGRLLIPVLILGLLTGSARAADMPWVRVADDKQGFVAGGQPFVAWGVNYDHDEAGRLIEDYWDQEWPKVEQDFAEMKELGVKVVRVHLQFGKFMNSPDEPNPAALDRLSELLQLSEGLGLYLDLTGLACYHKRGRPTQVSRQRGEAGV